MGIEVLTSGGTNGAGKKEILVANWGEGPSQLTAKGQKLSWQGEGRTSGEQEKRICFQTAQNRNFSKRPVPPTKGREVLLQGGGGGRNLAMDQHKH